MVNSDQYLHRCATRGSGTLGGMEHAQLSRLTDLVAEGDVVVWSGAGLSTESGIPDYRGPTGTAQHGRRRSHPSDLERTLT
jgi:hypothetical protein